MGRRRLWLVAIVVVGAVAVGVSYRMATQPMVVGRAVIGERPPPPPKAADLVGTRMPDFRTVDVSGSEVTSDMLRGRPAVVAIWTTWCAPCREEMPRIEQEIWQEHRDELAVVAIAGNEDASKVRQFNEEAGYTFTLVPDPGRRVTALFDADGPIPRTYVVDSSGMIVHQTVGYSEKSFAETVAKIDALLAYQGSLVR